MSDLWIADEDPDQTKLAVATLALGYPPDTPSYGPSGLRGLEIGGGAVPRRLAYTQFDAIDWSERVRHANGAPVQYDVGDARKLPYASGAFDHVFCSNLLEHFEAGETALVLTEWARVIRPHGALELIVPDFMGILRDYFAGRFSWDDTAERLLGSRDYDGNTHHAAFCRSEFPDVLAQVPRLELLSLKASHSGGGIHAVAVKL